MLILDLTSSRFIQPELDDQAEIDRRDYYPDEVLESEWNPALTQIQQVQQNVPEPEKPSPAIIESALARFYPH